MIGLGLDLGLHLEFALGLRLGLEPASVSGAELCFMLRLSLCIELGLGLHNGYGSTRVRVMIGSWLGILTRT